MKFKTPKYCGTLLWSEKAGRRADYVCTMPYGVEHTHGDRTPEQLVRLGCAKPRHDRLRKEALQK